MKYLKPTVGKYYYHEVLSVFINYFVKRKGKFLSNWPGKSDQFWSFSANLPRVCPNPPIHSEFVRLGRGTFNFFKRQNFRLESDSITPCNTQSKSWANTIFMLPIPFQTELWFWERAPCHLLKLCKNECEILLKAYSSHSMNIS